VNQKQIVSVLEIKYKLMAFFDKFFNSDKNKEEFKLKWKILESLEELDSALESSHSKPIAIFKHSTRCSISSMAKDRMERGWDFTDDSGPIMYYLDLISYRLVSNKISERLKVHHESPQLILVKNGEAIYDAAHNFITLSELKEALG